VHSKSDSNVGACSVTRCSCVVLGIRQRSLKQKQWKNVLHRASLKMTGAIFCPLGEASHPAGGWGDGARPSPRTSKENPRLVGDFPETASRRLSLVHNVEHVLKHVYAPRGLFLVKRIEKFIDLFAALVAVLGDNAVNRLKFDFFQ